MADKIWVGTASGHEGDLNYADNWSPSGVPTDGDNVFFISGSQDVTTNLDALASVNLNKLVVSSGYSGTIGDSSNYLNTNAGYFSYQGGKSSATDYIDVDVDNANVVAASKDAKLSLKGTITDLVILNGTITIAGGTITNLEVGGQTKEVSISSGVSITNVYQKRGGIESSVGCTLVELSGGTFTLSDGDITTVRLYGGTFYWNAGGSTISDLTIYAGSFDASGDSDSKTITNLTLYQNGSINLNNGASNITITNGIKTYNGTMELVPGCTLSISYS